MEVSNINSMEKGWFIGNFEPSLYKTNDVEVAVKQYKKGDSEQRHYHKIATEMTVIIRGKVKMNDRVLSQGEIVVLKPRESSDFECLEDNTTTVVVKIPGANNDKYIGDSNED